MDVAAGVLVIMAETVHVTVRMEALQAVEVLAELIMITPKQVLVAQVQEGKYEYFHGRR
jgi:hypothetical protein